MDRLDWDPGLMLEVRLNDPDDFLKVRETLSRIGVASRKERKLYHSCHILNKQGRYYIVHFKELFALDGKPTNLSQNDIETLKEVFLAIFSHFRQRSQPSIIVGFGGLSHEIKPLIKVCSYLPQSINSTMAC